MAAFCATLAEMSSCYRHLQSLKCLLDDPLQKKFANPDLDVIVI